MAGMREKSFIKSSKTNANEQIAWGIECFRNGVV